LRCLRISPRQGIKKRPVPRAQAAAQNRSSEAEGANE